MKSSIECLKELIEFLGEDWKQVLDDFFKESEIKAEGRGANEIIDFLDICKEEVIADKTSSLQKVEKLIDNDLLYKNVREYVDEILRPYYASAPLRTLEVKDTGAAVKAIEEIFARAILRFDPNIPQRFEEFGFENENAFIDFLNVFDAICTFVIGKNLCYEAMADFIFTKTRLPQKICTRVAQLLDENLSQLKINFIVERLNK